MQVTLDEIWALAKQHATGDEQLPTIDPDISDSSRNAIVSGMEVKFYIDNDPAVYYEVGDTDDLVYVDCEAARDDESMTGPFVDKEGFKERVRRIAGDQRARRY